MANYDSLITTFYDLDFDHLSTSKLLLYYPWIGIGYHESRIAVIAKHHCGKGDTHKEYTRERVEDNGIWKDETPFKTASEYLMGASRLPLNERKMFWSRVAFFNLKKEQTSSVLGKEDFERFEKISEIIEPRYCLFIDIDLDFNNGETSQHLKDVGFTINQIASFTENGLNAKVEIAMLSKGCRNILAAFTNSSGQYPSSKTDAVRNYFPKFF